MAGGSQIRTFPLLSQLTQSVTNFFSASKRPVYCPPTDGPVLKLHYKYSFFLGMLGFATVWYSWLYRDVIVCVSHFNADTQVRMDYVNICLSYPYITLEDGSKQYLLFYRWIHWVLFLVALAFYIPRKVAKSADSVKLTKLFDFLHSFGADYDSCEVQPVSAACRYLAFNVRTNDAVYFRYLYAHIIGLVINIGCFLSLDCLLLNKFAGLGYNAFPYTRDGQFFTDYISTTFPPFADCSIGEEQMLVNKRTETLGCHLTAMEFYEKLLLITWFWMIFVMIATTLYILYLVCFMSPFTRKYIVSLPKPATFKDNSLDEISKNAAKDFKTGDWFILHRMKSLFSPPGYCNILKKLSEPDYHTLVVGNMRKEKPVQSTAPLGFESHPNKGILVE